MLKYPCELFDCQRSNERLPLALAPFIEDGPPGGGDLALRASLCDPPPSAGIKAVRNQGTLSFNRSER